MPTLLERAQEDRSRLLAAPRDRTRFALTSETVRASRVKAADGGADQMVIEAPASSTCIDLMGDRMSLACLQSMQLQATGMTTWLNHSYDIPEDACGTIERAWINEAVDPQQGAVHDLWIRMVVAPGAKRAVECFELIASGQKYGFSIGGFIKDYAFEDLPDGDYCFVITELDLFEISLVGIPANQRAVVDGVSKAMFSLEQRSAALVAPMLRKSLGYPSDPAVKAAQRKALATRVLRGAEGEEGMPHVDEPPTTATPEPKPAEKTAPVAPPDQGPPKPRPGGLPAFNSFSLPVGALVVDIKTVDGGHALELLTAAGEIVANLGIAGETVTLKGATLAAGTRDKLEAVHNSVKDALDHGACPAVQKSMNDASDGLTSLLNEDDASDDGSTAAGIRAQLAERTTRFAELDAEIAALETERQKLVEQNAWLKDLVSRAHETSTGRVTQAVTPGYFGSATTDPIARRRSKHDVLADLSHALAGHDAGDARTRSLT